MPTLVELERRARAAGLSIVELSERAGISKSTLYRWRSGEGEPPLSRYELIIKAVETAEADAGGAA